MEEPIEDEVARLRGEEERAEPLPEMRPARYDVIGSEHGIGEDGQGLQGERLGDPVAAGDLGGEAVHQGPQDADGDAEMGGEAVQESGCKFLNW